MKKQTILTAVSVGLISLGMVGSAHATLSPRLGGLAYYDDVADLTWLADANYAQTSGYDADGQMNWQEAIDWAAQLTVGGVSGWRLPDTLQPDASCSVQNVTESSGFGCTGSEMGGLFYNALGNTNVFGNTGPFSNTLSDEYWSATEYAPSTPNAWYFSTFNGFQHFSPKTGIDNPAWAVQSGDVENVATPVPIHPLVWAIGSALLGLLGMSRFKKS